MLRIKTYLGERGSQASLAKATGIHESRMSKLVNGDEKVYPKWGKAIAAELGWDGDWRELFEPVEEEEVAS